MKKIIRVYDYHMIVALYTTVDREGKALEDEEQWISFESLFNRIGITRRETWLPWISAFSTTRLEEVLKNCTDHNYTVEVYCDTEKVSEGGDYYENAGITIKRIQ